MKKEIFTRTAILLLITCILISFAACSHEPALFEDTSLSVSVADAARTVLPLFDLNDMTFTLKGKLDGGQERVLGTYTSYEYLSTDKIPLSEGNWEFTLEAEAIIDGNTDVSEEFKEHYSLSYLEGAKFSGTTTKQIVTGKNSIQFQLNMISTGYDISEYVSEKDAYQKFGSGSVEIKLNLPADSNVYVKASMTDISPDSRWDDNNITKELQISDGSVTFDMNGIPAGYYNVVFTLYKDSRYQIKINSYKELVHVVSGCVSQAERTLQKINTTFFDITYNLGDGSFAENYAEPDCFVANQKVTLPDTSQVIGADGYVLEGWYDNSEFLGQRYTVLSGITNDMELYAKWIQGILVTEDTAADMSLSEYTEPVTVAYVGKVNSGLKTLITNSSVNVDLIIYTTEEVLPRVSSSGAFSGCSALRSVVIPEGITEIDEYTFNGCTNLTSITLPSTLISIDEYAFQSCSSLTEVHIADLKSYLNISMDWGSQPFYSTNSSKNCKVFVNNQEITSLVIPEGVGSIPKYAFKNCKSITSAIIPEGVTGIGAYAFQNCTGLSEIEIPDSVTEIGTYAFADCTILESVRLSESLTEIPEYAFYQCSCLQSVIIPEGVTEIGVRTFYKCSALTTVSFPSTLKTVSWGAFDYCSNFKNLEIADAAKYLAISINSSGNSVFFNNSLKITVNGEELTSLVIPDGITSIRNKPINKTVITSVTLPSSRSTIPEEEFKGFSALKSINIPEGVTDIDRFAFYECSSLVSVELPDTLRKIGDWAFYNTALESIEIPANVTEIGEEAFSSCNNLETVSFSPDSKLKLLGRAAFRWCENLTEISIPNSVKELKGYTFNECKKLSAINLPSSLITIGEYEFDNCQTLNSITIPEGVTGIGDYAFRNCNSLKSISLPSTLTSIGYNAFSSCGSLTNLYIADLKSYLTISTESHPFSSTYSSITCRVFIDNTEITSLVIPEGVVSIPAYAFRNCKNITSVTIPEGVTGIGDYAFNNCSNLTTITIPEGITSIGNYAFSNCSSLASVSLPSTLTSIGYEVFEDCSSLSSLSLSSTLTFIGNYVFAGCSSLTDLHISDLKSYLNISWGGWGSQPFEYTDSSKPRRIFVNNQEVTSLIIPEGVVSIPAYAFFRCNTITSVIIPEGVTSIGQQAFDGCSSLTSVTVPSDCTLGSSAFPSGITITRN